MKHFDLALQLARRAIGLSGPNPRVGCVIVAANGHIIGQGSTQAPGQAHAEIMALRDAASRGASPAGSTVYVTLEPCSHHGRTPPCCDALVAAGVAKVVLALQDPNPLVSGRGLQRLRDAGIDVELLAPHSPVARAAHEINIGFMQRMQHGLPWVRLKTACSLDGRTALPNGRSQWITDEAARADVQQWRARACAILTGIGTVLRDDPLLNLRLSPAELAASGTAAMPTDQPPSPLRQPHLIVLDSQLRTPPTARLFSVPNRQVWLCACQAAAHHTTSIAQRAATLQAAGAEIIWLPANTRGQPDLHALLQELAQREINELHVEAGATLNGALLQQGLVDEIVAYIAPLLLGPGMPLADLPELNDLAATPRWQLCEAQPLEQDVRLRLRQAVQAPTTADATEIKNTAAAPAPAIWGDDLPFSKKTTEAEIAALFDRWNTALQTGDPKNIAALYEQNAVLLPTVSNKLCLTHADIEDYFLHFMEKKPIGKIDQRCVQIEHNQAIDSGLYTFTFGETGEQLQARYTYTYRWNGKEWKISSHHSSAMPIKQLPNPS